MSFSTKPQDVLEQLLVYGASLEIAILNRTVDQLYSLASYAKSGGGTLTVLGASGLSNQVLYELAAYGKGHIFLKD